MDSQDKKPQKDPRRERLARQLRANLQRRKEQARERDSETPDDDAPAKGGGGRDTGPADA